MILLTLLDGNVKIRMTSVSANYDYVYDNGTITKISGNYALRVKALTTRYYYVTQGIFQSKQFTNVSGIRSLVVNFFDRFNNKYINATATYVISVSAGMNKILNLEKRNFSLLYIIFYISSDNHYHNNHINNIL